MEKITFNELRNKIRKQYKVGQVVNMRDRDTKGNIVRRYKARIITFYPYTVSCDVDGRAESYTYFDFNLAIAQRRES